MRCSAPADFASSHVALQIKTDSLRHLGRFDSHVVGAPAVGRSLRRSCFPRLVRRRHSEILHSSSALTRNPNANKHSRTSRGIDGTQWTLCGSSATRRRSDAAICMLFRVRARDSPPLILHQQQTTVLDLRKLRVQFRAECPETLLAFCSLLVFQGVGACRAP